MSLEHRIASVKLRKHTFHTALDQNPDWHLQNLGLLNRNWNWQLLAFNGTVPTKDVRVHAVSKPWRERGRVSGSQFKLVEIYTRRLKAVYRIPRTNLQFQSTTVSITRKCSRSSNVFQVEYLGRLTVCLYTYTEVLLGNVGLQSSGRVHGGSVTRLFTQQ